LEWTGTHVAVVGAGASGLYAALSAAREGAPVTLISATALAGSSTYWAQGGLAAAVAPDDSVDRHLEDTIAAGRGAVRRSAAEVLCAEAAHAVEDLIGLGIAFDLDAHGRLALGLEGGHSARRIVHAGGAATGQRLIEHLTTLVADEPRVTVLESARAVALAVDEGGCRGVLLDNDRGVRAAATILATGGAAALWARTTNPVGAAGSGLLLAHRAGAALADLELVQFHPTAVVGRDGADGFLVTEAIRGEGAKLLNGNGEQFVDELAPRDEVARAIHRQMAVGGAVSVDLDMRHVDPGLFPNVVSALRRAGIDPQRQLVPVAPAAHYTMGGIATDLHGRSTLPGLYAVGECGCTGLHGANRLASNSLTECFVFGARAARSAAAEPGAHCSAEAAGIEDDRHQTPSALPSAHSRHALWRHAGIERDAEGLRTLAGDRHPLVRLIAAAALAREESRGAHQRRDYPQLDPHFDNRHVVFENGVDAPTLQRWE
jgi:L-aspartate oxidase